MKEKNIKKRIFGIVAGLCIAGIVWGLNITTTKAAEIGMTIDQSEWHAVVNGATDQQYTGMACNEYGWWYFENGNIDLGYTGMAVNEYGWWYFENGNINLAYTGMACNEYGWWYFGNGNIDDTYSAMGVNDLGWWKYDNGRVDFQYTGLALNEYGWWYFNNGAIDFDFYGMAQNEYGWWPVLSGHVDSDFTGMAVNEYGWWHYDHGMLDPNYTGIGHCGDVIRYINNGAIDMSYTGLVLDTTADCWVYMVNGEFMSEYTGAVLSGTDWWYVEQGVINWDYTGMICKDDVWWFVENGWLNPNYTGLGSFAGCLWYYNNGNIDYNYVGEFVFNSQRYKVKDGKAEQLYVGWAQNANGDMFYYDEAGNLKQAVGVDVSTYQGDIDWDAVKNSGEVQFAIIRIGYGDNDSSQDDKKAIRNMDECERLGIPYGVYLFSYAVSTEQAYSEADHLLRMLENRNPILGVYYDVENVSSTKYAYNDYYLSQGLDPFSQDGRRRLTDYTKIVLNRLSESGYKAGIYVNQNYYWHVLYMDELAGYRWLAAWGGYDECPIGGCKMWQYTSSGTVTGIEGRVDMDLWLNN